MRGFFRVNFKEWKRLSCTCVLQADVAKLETSLSLSGYRIELKIFGFSEKLPVLAQKIASQMQNLASTELEFKVLTYFFLKLVADHGANDEAMKVI